MRIHVTIYYTNGTTKDYKFHTYSEADWFIHNEGIMSFM